MKKKFIIFILILASFLIFIVNKSKNSCSMVRKNKGNLNAKMKENLKFHVYKISHEIGTRDVFEYEKLIKTASYIEEEFEKQGLEVTFQKYEAYGKEFKNIIATIKGSSETGETVIIGAHYDSFNNKGADDNASGISMLIELAKEVSLFKPAKTIKFIAFVNEEPPFFKTESMGSYVYANEAKKKNEKIDAVLILEMTGYYSEEPDSQSYPPFLGFLYPDKGNFIAFVGNLSSAKITEKTINYFRKATDFPSQMLVSPSIVQGVDFSDQWGFWKLGYSAVMVTDTAFYRNPNYHTDSDTYDTLNYEKMNEVMNGLRHVIIKLTER